MRGIAVGSVRPHHDLGDGLQAFDGRPQQPQVGRVGHHVRESLMNHGNEPRALKEKAGNAEFGGDLYIPGHSKVVELQFRQRRMLPHPGCNVRQATELLVGDLVTDFGMVSVDGNHKPVAEKGAVWQIAVIREELSGVINRSTS